MTGRTLFLLFFGLSMQAQQDSIALREVIVSDRPLAMIRETSVVFTVADSLIARNGNSLAGLLRDTPAYFKENGFGMVASPALRGTTAQHTAVIWNGINVNSAFHGQMDFNAGSASDFDIVTLRPGGTSSTHGSSAIGGSVHLENRVRFNSGTSARVDAAYGSFNTSALHLGASHSDDKVAFSASASHYYSDNDYSLPSGRKNSNGRLRNTGFSTVASWRPGMRNRWTYYGHSTVSDRNFSLLFPTDPKTRYRDNAFRNLLEWAGDFGWFSPTIKAAVITEEYRFFEGADSPGQGWGRALTQLIRGDAGICLGRGRLLNLVAENTSISARGSDVGTRTRNVFSASALFRHEVSDNFVYNASVRQESPSDYKSPLLFAAGAKFRIVKNHFARANVAKSFRAPTFNDLYWGTGGNPDLKPETSLQTEAGYVLESRQITIQATAFANRISNMIRWLPAEAGQWFPVNEHEVQTYGVELSGSAGRTFGRHRISANGYYAYTASQNDSGRQLIYVPMHKAGLTADWQFRKFSASAAFRYTGPVHTRSDNDPRYALDGYAVADARLGYGLGKFSLGIRVQNILDRQYEAVERRYFPGRNFMIEFTFKT